MDIAPDSLSDAAAIKARLSDQRWRLNNLYWITNEKGQRIPFRLNWAQNKLLDSRQQLLDARRRVRMTLLEHRPKK